MPNVAYQTQPMYLRAKMFDDELSLDELRYEEGELEKFKQARHADMIGSNKSGLDIYEQTQREYEQAYMAWYFSRVRRIKLETELKRKKKLQ